MAKHRAPPEDSVPYRIGVTVLVLFCLVLTLHQIEWPSYWPAVLLATTGASVMSYYRRNESNIGLKIMLSFAMVFLLLWFFSRLAASVYDPRIPLAELLIWLQALHAFDLPAKKDLRYTGLVALILIAISCVLSYQDHFWFFLVLFSLLFLFNLHLDYSAAQRALGCSRKEPAPALASRDLNNSWLARTGLKYLSLAFLCATLIFLFMPRFQGLRLRSLPVTWDMQFTQERVSQGEISNKSLNRTPADSNGKPRRIQGDSYFGFDSEVNLNSRGNLSDNVVLKVRSSNWQYHRGVTFAEYTGVSWKAINWNAKKQKISKPPFYFPSLNPRDDRVTIYYNETDLSNIVLSPAGARRVFFPSNELFVVTSFQANRLPRGSINTPATLISPFYLEEGAVYSVVNEVPDASVRSLAGRETDWSQFEADYFEPFLQLPKSVTGRTRTLAESLTRDKTSAWAKASALSSHLQNNYSYDLRVDFYPEGADTADHFLFEERIGYCEQFATALCVLARSAGLPARYTTGYLPGKFNPITGFYEIKASDAHAWAEIYIDGYGWMMFDPVPGGVATPQLEEGAGQKRWLLEALLDYLGLPEELQRLAPNFARLLSLLGLFGLLGLAKWRKSKPQENISECYPYLREAESLVGRRGVGETVKTWAERHSERPQLAVIAQVYEEFHYRDQALTAEAKERLESALTELKAENL